MVEIKIPGTENKERLYYWCLPGAKECRIFVHEHIPVTSTGHAVIFLNPVLDEKKRVQRFQAQTARYCASKGLLAFRFDYFGTGDSEGASHELDMEQSLVDTMSLIHQLAGQYHIEKISLFGIRLGADVALHLAHKNPSMFKTLHLLEPIVNGKRYLLEQRMRRQAFAKLKQLNVQERVNINGKSYEDFQGFVWSDKMVQFVEDIRTDQVPLKDRDLHIYKINYFASRKLINELADRLSEHNKVSLHPCDGKDFWASMDPLDTKALSMFLAEVFNS